jgi:dTDP-glucose 4,6-dehydratase
MAYHRYHDVDTRIVRIFNTYGPRMRLDDGRALPTFIHQALIGENLTVFGDGKQTRSFCYIDDEVKGIYSLLIQGGSDPVNIGNPNEVTILELAEKILDVTDSKSEIEFKALPQDDPRVRQPDISKAEKELHWKPEIDLETGLYKTIENFKERLKIE